MLIFKRKKNIFKYITICFVFLILITVFSFPNKTLATDQTITLERASCQIQGTTPKWAWGFKITTTNVPNDTKIYAYLKQGDASVKNETLSVKDNYAQFDTGPILDFNTTYAVAVVVEGIPKLAASFAEKTPTIGITTCTTLPPITVTFTPNTAVNTDTTYTFLQPLPGFEKTIDTQKNDTTNPCPFGNYLNILIKLFFGICGVLAVVMIVMGGIEYMTSELISSKEAGKETIRNALLGLLLALGAYLILNTINPDLLKVCLNTLPKAEITIGSGEEYRLSQTQTTDTKFKRTSYYDQIKTTVGSKFPPCLLQATIQRESGGIPKLVGHDEDAPSAGIVSRRDYVGSGKKFSGATFTSNNNLITDRTFFDDDHISNQIHTATDLTKDDLGLDWRFSHSLGMFGITFFPAGKSPAYTTKLGVPGLGSVGVKEILNNTNNADLLYSIDLMSKYYNSCNKDVLQTYYKWATGSCQTSNGFALKEGGLRKSLYDQCVTQDK